MSSADERRAAMVQALGQEVRRMSAQGVLLSSAVAARVGLSSTDLECLDFIAMAGANAITAGRLAALTGLTTGAITGLIDRLERAGLARRESDPADRRKVCVVAVPERVLEIGRYYERLAQRTAALWSEFSEEQLRTVLKFTRESIELANEEIAHIRSMPPLKTKRPTRQSVAKRSGARS